MSAASTRVHRSQVPTQAGVARLCARKHQHGNGLIANHELPTRTAAGYCGLGR